MTNAIGHTHTFFPAMIEDTYFYEFTDLDIYGEIAKCFQSGYTM
jgi:hypothetical protein